MGKDTGSDRVCVGAITGAHGVRGLVKIKPFTEDPADLAAYGPLDDEKGTRQFRPELLSQAKGQWIARLDGITDRDAAQALARTRLYIDRAALPSLEEEDTFYHADLIGLAAIGEDGVAFGTVTAIYDFGSGDVLEIAPKQGSVLVVPFTKETVPEIDVSAGRLTVIPAEELEAS